MVSSCRRCLSDFSLVGILAYQNQTASSKSDNDSVFRKRLVCTKYDSYKKISKDLQHMWTCRIHLRSTGHLAQGAPDMQKGQQSWGQGSIWISTTSVHRLKGYFLYTCHVTCLFRIFPSQTCIFSAKYTWSTKTLVGISLRRGCSPNGKIAKQIINHKVAIG